MKRVAQISAAIGAAVTGLGAAIFLHPRSGARRRQVAAGVARRQSANVATLVGSSVGRSPTRRGRRDDQLAEDVKSELVQRFGAAAETLHVSAHRGTVTLRGEVGRLEDIDAYEEAARAADVSEVNNLLRLAAAAPAAPP